MPSRRRKLVWARTPVVSQALVAGASANFTDLLQNFKADAGITGTVGITVMRIRLEIFAATLTAGAIPFHVGIRVCNDSDIAQWLTMTTLTLAPFGPEQDEYADWMMWKACYPNHGSDPVTGVPNAATYEIDVRAMRKIDELGQTLCIWMSKGASTNGNTINHSSSVLLALP